MLGVARGNGVFSAEGLVCASCCRMVICHGIATTLGDMLYCGGFHDPELFQVSASVLRPLNLQWSDKLRNGQRLRGSHERSAKPLTKASPTDLLGPSLAA